MKKLYIFANEIEPELRDIAIAIVMYYCAVFEENLQSMAPEIKLDFLAWSNRSDEIGVVYEYDGPNKKALYDLADKIDTKLSNEGLATTISEYWTNNFQEFMERTEGISWADYGCVKPKEAEFVKKLSRDNVAKVLNGIIVNLINE